MPHMEQHELDRYMPSRLGNVHVTQLLTVTPSNPLPHPLSSPSPFHFVSIKFKGLVAKQHPANMATKSVQISM